MNFPAHGPWLSEDGPDTDVVMSCRVRLARNVAGFPFVGHASDGQRREILNIARQVVLSGDVADDMMRVTAATEKRFFEAPLSERPILLAGVEKKQIRAADHVRCALDVERPPSRLFFPQVGDAFACRPLTARQTLARLSAPLVPIHRFTDTDDRRDFLAFLGGLARQVEACELTLSRDLDELARLTEVVS